MAALNHNKSTGLDNISVKILKSMLPVNSPNLTALKNSSFSPGNFPDFRKRAHATWLFKKAQCLRRAVLEQYQYFLFLPVSKVFERAMYTRLYCFMKKGFSEKQFGFRNRCSTVLATAEIVEKLRFNMTSLKHSIPLIKI